MAAELGFLLQRSTQQNNISPVCFKGIGPAVFPQRARCLLKHPLRSANAWRRRGLAQRLVYQQLMCVTSCFRGIGRAPDTTESGSKVQKG